MCNAHAHVYELELPRTVFAAMNMHIMHIRINMTCVMNGNMRFWLAYSRAWKFSPQPLNDNREKKEQSYVTYPRLRQQQISPTCRNLFMMCFVVSLPGKLVQAQELCNANTHNIRCLATLLFVWFYSWQTCAILTSYQLPSLARCILAGMYSVLGILLFICLSTVVHCTIRSRFMIIMLTKLYTIQAMALVESTNFSVFALTIAMLLIRTI